MRLTPTPSSHVKYSVKFIDMTQHVQNRRLGGGGEEAKYRKEGEKKIENKHTHAHARIRAHLYVCECIYIYKERERSVCLYHVARVLFEEPAWLGVLGTKA